MVPAERARPYLQTIETHDMGTDFVNAVFVDVCIILTDYLLYFKCSSIYSISKTVLTCVFLPLQ